MNRTADTRSARRIENGRLACYGRVASADYWDSYWKDRCTREMYAPYVKGATGWVEPALSFLPKDGRILEAGCGLGVHVAGLRGLGYDCEGVEWGAETVELVNSVYPELPIRVGDVSKLDVPDGHYSAYISFGVMEHAYDGPQEFLREAYRVLAPGGTALISVPFFGPLRRLKAALGFYRDDVTGIDFYQYEYGKGEFCRAVESAGFKVFRTWSYDARKGITDEIPWLGKALVGVSRIPKVGYPVRRLLKYSPFGHMLLVAARKER